MAMVAIMVMVLRAFTKDDDNDAYDVSLSFCVELSKPIDDTL